jgi:hypothetical protein
MMYGKPKAAKAKKPAPKKGMAMGGMASSPEALQAMAQRPLKPGETRVSATPGPAPSFGPAELAALEQQKASNFTRPNTAPMQTASPVPLPKVKPRRSGSTPVTKPGRGTRGTIKPGTPGKPKPGTPGVRVFDDSGMGIKNPSGYTNPVPTTDKTGKPLKGMAMGGMTKKGYNKGGMANCGASMKPAQGKGK